MSHKFWTITALLARLSSLKRAWVRRSCLRLAAITGHQSPSLSMMNQMAFAGTGQGAAPDRDGSGGAL